MAAGFWSGADALAAERRRTTRRFVRAGSDVLAEELGCAVVGPESRRSPVAGPELRRSPVAGPELRRSPVAGRRPRRMETPVFWIGRFFQKI
jgi:hypothetical protein